MGSQRVGHDSVTNTYLLNLELHSGRRYQKLQEKPFLALSRKLEQGTLNTRRCEGSPWVLLFSLFSFRAVLLPTMVAWTLKTQEKTCFSPPRGTILPRVWKESLYFFFNTLPWRGPQLQGTTVQWKADTERNPSSWSYKPTCRGTGRRWCMKILEKRKQGGGPSNSVCDPT